MRFPDWLLPHVYGDQQYRGFCASEEAEQQTFFQTIRIIYPSLGAIAFHPGNEGRRSIAAGRRRRAAGVLAGTSDIVIPAAPLPFVCEMKRRDHTKSKWEEGQIEYLAAALAEGAFVCVALGSAGALLALDDWRALRLGVKPEAV